MLGWRLGVVAAMGLVAGNIAFGCGGTVRGDGSDPDGSAGTGAFGGTSTGGTHTGGTGGTVFGGGGAGTGGIPFGGGGTGGTGGTYVDPGCPDAQAPPGEFECDPLGPNTCEPGEACMPFIIYPSKPCDFEVYGAQCSLAGSTQQGEPCGNFGGSVALCAPGLACFITGQGTECLQLCQIGKPNACPPGLLCGATDVEGVGACN